MNEYKFLDSSNSTWWINRDGGINVNSEWESANSWSGTLRILPKIVARLHIYGRYTATSFGCKPKSWSCELDINNRRFRVPTTHRSCKSIPDAVYHAERGLTDKFIIGCLTRFYVRKNAACVSKLDKRKNPIPFITAFGRQDWMEMDYGVYVFTEFSHLGLRRTGIERFSFGYSGHGYGGYIPQWINYERIYTQGD